MELIDNYADILDVRVETDPQGRPLALVIFRNRSFEYIPHDELGR